MLGGRSGLHQSHRVVGNGLGIGNRLSHPRDKVASALETILRTRQFAIEDAQEVWSSLTVYRAGGDFADALIAAVNLRHGCQHTATFDRRAARQAGFTAIS